jgi:hypothetical protein
MKAKLNFDKNAIKNFFIDHTEKVVFGAVLLGVVALIYGAVNGREKIDKTPGELTDKVAAAKSNIERSNLVVAPAGDVDRIAEISRQPIKEEFYQLAKRINPPPKMERQRGAPPVFAVEELRLASDMSMFQVSNAGNLDPAKANASELRGQRWVVITGLVPLKKQIDAYYDAFSDCKPSKNDSQPVYLGYRIERLEITSPADIENPNWKNAKKFAYKGPEVSAPKDWGQLMPDVVDSRYVDPSVTFPLGPWTDGTWGASVAHEPKIPVFNMNGPVLPPKPEAEPEATPDAQQPADEFGGRPPAGNALNPQPMQAAGGHAPPGYGGMIGPRPGGYGMPGGAMNANMDSSVDYRLFRYFDFTVEPGKRYIYRVQLVVQNPNYGVKAAYLEKPEMATETYLKDAPWSDKSPVASVPNNTSTLAVAVEQPKRPTGEPIGSMLVALWQDKTGQKVYNEFGVERGQFLNFLNAKTKNAERRGGPAPGPDSDEKTDLLSNVLVVDLAGGKKLPSKKPPPAEEPNLDQFEHKRPGNDRLPFSPGEILVMDANGTLLVRNEFDDMTAVDNYTAKPDQGSTPLGPGPRGPGVFGPGPMGPGGFGPAGYGPAGYGPAGTHGPGGAVPPGYGGLFGNPQPQRQPQTPRK